MTGGSRHPQRLTELSFSFPRPIARPTTLWPYLAHAQGEEKHVPVAGTSLARFNPQQARPTPPTPPETAVDTAPAYAPHGG
jgi:hypothetical protein